MAKFRKRYFDKYFEDDYVQERGGFFKRYLGSVDRARLRFSDEKNSKSPVLFYIQEIIRRVAEMLLISFAASGCLLFVFQSLLWSYIVSNKDGYERILIGLSFAIFFGLNFYLLRRMILITNDLKMYIMVNAFAYIIYTAINIIVFFFVTAKVYFSTFLYTLLISSFALSQLTSLIITHVIYLVMLVFIGIWGVKRYVNSELSAEDYRAMQRGRRRSVWRS